jgi:hypothetical protein
VYVSAAFPNTSRNEVTQTFGDADPGIVRWVDTWLYNRRIFIELDGN